MDNKNAHSIPFVLEHDTSTGYTDPHHEISQFEDFQRITTENETLTRRLEEIQHALNHKDAWLASHIEYINQQHTEHIMELQRNHFTCMESLVGKHQATMAALQMAHSAYTRNAEMNRHKLQLCIQELEQTVESQQLELSDRAEVDAQMRQVELRAQRLNYVQNSLRNSSQSPRKRSCLLLCRASSPTS